MWSLTCKNIFICFRTKGNLQQLFFFVSVYNWRFEAVVFHILNCFELSGWHESVNFTIHMFFWLVGIDSAFNSTAACPSFNLIFSSMSFNFLRDISKKRKAKFSTQMGHFRRFFYSKFSNRVKATSANMFTLLNVKLISDQFVAN